MQFFFCVFCVFCGFLSLHAVLRVAVLSCFFKKFIFLLDGGGEVLLQCAPFSVWWVTKVANWGGL